MSGNTSYTLSQLLGSVRRCLEAGFTGKYWIQAETSDLRRSGAAGHAYLELLEKGANGAVIAKVRANIWASRYDEILYRFTKAGLPPITSGVTILALVQVSFHEQFGLSLIIQDIDTNYALGEIARLRMETIARLKQAGLFTRNKALSLGRPLQRLAVISSASAAGYGDFMNHIRGNRYGVVCYTALFVAQMQGEQTTPSVISALERIKAYLHLFDAVVIIRGGGAVSDLRAFDSYELCATCAQYPLPIISGIGHERDESVLDLIAHTSQKTPTAVADFIISTLLDELAQTQQLASRLQQGIVTLTTGRNHWLHTIGSRLPSVAGYALERAHRKQTALRGQLSLASRQLLHVHTERLNTKTKLLPYLTRNYKSKEEAKLQRLAERIPYPVATHRARRQSKLEQYEQAIRLAHPENVLKRGFAILEREGKIITSPDRLSAQDSIEIHMHSGRIRGMVTEVSTRSEDVSQR